MLTHATERTTSTLQFLSWRNLRGPADYRVLANIGRRCNLADHVDELPTVEAIAHEMQHPVNFHPSEDVLIGEIHGRPVAWQKTSWRLESNGRYIYMLAGFVSPGWRQRGIGRELVRRGEHRLLQVAAGHPAGAERYYSTFSPASRAGKLALFESEGYRPVRHFYNMLRASLDDLPTAPMPAGLELRPVQPEHLRLIWDANEEAFRDDWGPMVMTDEDFNRWPQQPDFDPSLWQVAWDIASNQVAGVTLNAIPRAANAAHKRLRGLVENVSVRRPWRQRGLGRALLVASLRALRERGQTEAMLGVDAENPTARCACMRASAFGPLSMG